MNAKKGMSQVLAIIVAASVLMMVGLTLTVLTQGSIADIVSGSDAQACESTLSSKCEAQDAGTVTIPNSCYAESGKIDKWDQIKAAVDGQESQSADTWDCN